MGPDLCLICTRGLPNSKHKCNPKSKCSLSNCSYCQFGLYFEEICFKCKNNYLNTEIGCVHSSKIKTKIKGCSRYKGTLDRCARCKAGYYINQNQKCGKTKIHFNLKRKNLMNGLNSGAEWGGRMLSNIFLIFGVLLLRS